MRRAVRAGVLIAGGATTALAIWARLAATNPPSNVLTTLHSAAGLAFIVVGVIVWSRRPNNRVGVLLTLVGFTWFIYDLGYTPSSAAFTLADMEGSLYLAIVGHLVLAFPSGRLQSPFDRAIVAVIYVWAIFGNIIPEVIWAQPAPLCDCAHNLLGWRVDNGHHVFAGSAHQVVNAGLTALVFAVLVSHWVRATPTGRRALGPVAWASGPIVVTVIGLQTVGVVASLSWLEPKLPYMTPSALLTLPVCLLFGVVRSSLARLAVGRLVVELGDAPAPDHFRDALTGALHDPSLEVFYWVDERAQYVDANGQSVRLPAKDSRRGVTYLRRHGHPVAALVHDPSLEDDPALMEAVAATVSLALENERLDAALRAQLAEVRASRARIVAAGDSARRRIERDLHDGAQQRLVNLSLHLSMAQEQLGHQPTEVVASTLWEASAQLDHAFSELRELAAGIHPTILTEAGLGPALQSMAERASLPVTVDCRCAERLPRDVEAAAYFVVSEAITNVAKHAHAKAARVSVAHDNGVLRVQVDDDGVGGAVASQGSGLLGLADRVAALNGRLHLDSAPNRGTRLVAEIPCAS